jgi:hypothetical protein
VGAAGVEDMALITDGGYEMLTKTRYLDELLT